MNKANNNLKKLLKIICIASIVMVIAILGIYLWLNLRIGNVIDKEAYSQIIENINESDTLPDRFYEMYGRVTGYTEESTTNRYILLGIFNREKSCPCRDVSYHGVAAAKNFNLYAINVLTLGLALDRDVSPKKCLNYSLSKFDFMNYAIGIREASQFYFQKELDKLSDEEMMKLSIMTLNPARYNPIRNHERLESKLREIQALNKDN